MSDAKQRVEQELDELTGRKRKLYQFLISDKLVGLQMIHQRLLWDQYWAMEHLAAILEVRLQNW